MIKRKGLAQIPLMIGLLIMAVAVPVVTKLVQQNQDTRNRAASVISPPPSGCTEGYVRCINNNTQQRCQNGSWVFQKNCPNGCSGNYCRVIVPTPTNKPGLTPITCKPGIADPGYCGGPYAAGKYCPSNQRAQTYMLSDCSSFIQCVYDSKCPTPTPTKRPTATPTKAPIIQCNKNTVGKCGAAGGCKLGEKCKTYDNISYVCRIDDSCKQLPPTNTPTATPTNPPISVCSKYPMPNGCNCSNGSGCSSGYCSEAGRCENPPQTSKCPGAEACPNSKQPNLLQNCTPPDSDGTTKDTLCTTAGMKASCGGKEYCCPSAGGAWTTDMSKCPTTCTQCAGKPEAKSKGDADCSGVTNLNDFSIWRGEFITGALGVTVKNSWRADFDCNGKVNLNDFSIWRDNFIKSL